MDGRWSRAAIAPVVPCPAPYGYRNRIMIRSQWNKPEQKLNIGFVRGDGGLVEDITECKIAEPVLNEEILRVRANPPPKLHRPAGAVAMPRTRQLPRSPSGCTKPTPTSRPSA